MERSNRIISLIIAFSLFSTFSCNHDTENSRKPLLISSNGPVIPDTYTREFQNVLETARSTTGTKSISATILLGDGSELSAVANVSGDTDAVTSDMHFSVGSCTKTYVTEFVFKLIEQNRLTLDDTLQVLMYDTGILNEEYKSKIDPHIRIKDLLNHRTGIDDFLGDYYYIDICFDLNSVWDPYKTLSYVTEPYYTYNYIDPEKNQFSHSNTDFILLGLIIENITGKKILSVINKYILNPLNMKDTYMAGVDPYWGLTSIPGPNAIGFEKVIDTWIASSELITEDAIAVYSSTWTSGNMISTAPELARWAKVYYQYQLRNGYIDGNEFNEGDISSSHFKERKFGYGIEYLKHERNSELWGHTGTIIGFNSLMFYMPSKDISIAILINDHRILRWDILDAI